MDAGYFFAVALPVALIAALVVGWVAIRRTKWYARSVASLRAAEAAKEAERQRRATTPPMSGSEVAANFGSCLIALIALGIVGLVAVAIVLWAWRTVFGHGP